MFQSLGLFIPYTSKEANGPIVRLTNKEMISLVVVIRNIYKHSVLLCTALIIFLFHALMCFFYYCYVLLCSC